MGRSATPATLVLGLAGVLFLLGGIGGLVGGLYLAEWIHAQLPEVTADADAIGGAAFALGVALLFVATAHLVLALGVARRWRVILLPAAVVSAGMLVAVAGWGVAALVTAAAGLAAPALMLPAGAALLLLAAAYGWATRVVIGLWGETRRPG
ncbi:MAG TPA: hypothetical protein VFH63_04445 [candidate division Zixibacteria bacterium]|nr:hypothetical protein [candidate division Zixibacteria bacterium]